MEEEKIPEQNIIFKRPKDSGIMRMTAHQYEQKIHDLQEDVRRLKLSQDEVDGNNYKLEMDQKALQNDLEGMSKQLENTKKAATDRYLPHITQLTAEIKEQEVRLI